jgi:hypothetical protein
MPHLDGTSIRQILVQEPVDRHTQCDGRWSREWNGFIRGMWVGAVMFQTCIRSAWEQQARMWMLHQSWYDRKSGFHQFWYDRKSDFHDAKTVEHPECVPGATKCKRACMNIHVCGGVVFHQSAIALRALRNYCKDNQTRDSRYHAAAAT